MIHSNKSVGRRRWLLSTGVCKQTIDRGVLLPCKTRWSRLGAMADSTGQVGNTLTLGVQPEDCSSNFLATTSTQMAKRGWSKFGPIKVRRLQVPLVLSQNDSKDRHRDSPRRFSACGARRHRDSPRRFSACGARFCVQHYVAQLSLRYDL